MRQSKLHDSDIVQLALATIELAISAPEIPGWAKPTPRVSKAVDGLADHDIHRNAAVL